MVSLVGGLRGLIARLAQRDVRVSGGIGGRVAGRVHAASGHGRRRMRASDSDVGSFLLGRFLGLAVRSG